MRKQTVQTPAVDERDISAYGEFGRIVREAARHHDEAPGSSFGGHHPVQLIHHRDADFERLRRLELGREFFGPLAEYQVNAAIRPRAAGLNNLVHLQAEDLTHQHFKFTPSHVFKRIDRFALRNIGYQGLALASPDERAKRAK